MSYDDACLLFGAIQMYRATRREEFREVVLRFADHYVSGTGEINTYRPEDFKLDDILGGATSCSRRRRLASRGISRPWKASWTSLSISPGPGQAATGTRRSTQTRCGWTDFLWLSHSEWRMTQDTAKGTKYIDILNQFYNARDTLRDPKTGLYHHGYDESRTVF